MAGPYAYKANAAGEAIRMPDGKVFAMSSRRAQVADVCAQPVIDIEISKQYVETWKAMEQLVDDGKTKLIGNYLGFS